ncbi:MAG TPA: hypothetical protein VJ728_01390, partial [Candidatus Binataceae bacterium]|nr:hypothetical protein [Candidatus Binataceae bacterium]
MRPILMGYVLIPVIIIATSLVAPANAQPAFTLTSPSFQNSGKIPTGFTCSGRNVSPALQWRGAPSGTRSLSLLLADPDAPMGTFVHWVIYNISPDTSG